MEAPTTPTMEFRAMDYSETFEIFDGGSAIENRKRRRSSLRRVSFAEQPSIHVFARDDDYETPPEGTMSRLSMQSTPSSVSRSPQRRSERLSAARGGRQDDNEVDKENVQASAGNNARQKRRGRRPLAVRDKQREDEEEFLKPSNWLDDHENYPFGSCDENTGPVDLHHISMCDQIMAVEDDDNMTMDSQMFHTRMSQMRANQALPRLSEGRETPSNYTDMLADVSVLWTEKKAEEVERKLSDQPTWHNGDGNFSDMTQDSIVLLRGVAVKKFSRKESSIHATEEKTAECWDNWTEGDAQSQGRISSEQIERPVSQFDADDAVSMETSSPISDGDRRKLFVDDGQQANSRNLCDANRLHGSQLQGSWTSNDTESHSRRLVIASEKRTLATFDNDDNVSMEKTSQCFAGGRESPMKIHSGTVERLFKRDMHTSTTLKKSTSTEPLCTALEFRVRGAAEPNVTLVDDDNGSDPSAHSSAGAGEDSPVLLRHYERSHKRMSTSTAEKNNSGWIHPQMDSNVEVPTSQGHAQSMTVEPVTGQQGGQHGQGLERQESFLQQRISNKESRKSIGLQSFDGSVHLGIKSGKLLRAPDEDTDSMDITRTWTEHAPQLTSVTTNSSDSAKSFLWEDRDQRMDISDGDLTERYQEGITEAIPKLTSVLGDYSCDSPSVEPLNRIFQRKSDIDAVNSAVYGVTDEIGIQKEKTFKKGDDTSHIRVAEETESVSNRGLEEDTVEMQADVGKIRNVFQNPEDTLSFKGYQKNSRETSVSTSMGQNLIPRPAFPSVQGKVDVTVANLSNRSAQQSLGQDVQDEDVTAEFADQHNWRAEVSSDMSTTPLSPRRSKNFQCLVLKAQTVPLQIDTTLTDSLLQDDISAATPNVQDLLATDAESPESGLGGNPRKIVWSAQRSNLHALGGEVLLRLPALGQMDDEATQSMADKICTPRGPEEKKHIFECMSEEAAMTLNQVSHSKEVRNSVVSKMLLRMMSLQDNGCAQGESSSDAESRQSLRRTLHFQPESDSHLQSRPVIGDAEQRISGRDPDGKMEEEILNSVDEEMDSNESRVKSLQQESRRQKLRQEVQVAEERLFAMERRSEELRKRAEDCHQAIARKFRDDNRFEIQEMAAFGPYGKLKKRLQLLNCMQSWDLKTTKNGDGILHKFDYWELLTHSVFERTDNNLEFSVSKSSIDLNEAGINQALLLLACTQVYRYMNASLAWKWLLSGHAEIVPPQSLFHHVQGVHSKVMVLLDLMEEVDNCREYLVTPHFQLQTGSGLRLNLQFSDSELLFDFVLSFDMNQVMRMSHATEMNQKLDCTVQIESPGWSFGTKITDADIKRSVTSVVPGHQLLLRVCASINTLMHFKE